MDWTDPDVKRDERGLPYSEDPQRYWSLCRHCHRAFDAAHLRDPDGYRAELPALQRVAWQRESDEKRELHSRQRETQRRLFVQHHYPQYDPQRNGTP